MWLQGYGFVRVFRFAAPDGSTEGAEYWASSDPELRETQRAPLAALAWGIEQYHRGLKQCCGVEKAQVRAAKAQRNHIGYALRAFLRLEAQRLQTGRSWYEAKKQLLREGYSSLLEQPNLCFASGNCVTPTDKGANGSAQKRSHLPRQRGQGRQ